MKVRVNHADWQTKTIFKRYCSRFSAVVQIGKEGITDNVINSVTEALAARELIKVKINQNSAENIRKAAKLLSEESGCEIVQIIGRNCILFKQKDKNLIMISPENIVKAKKKNE